MRIQGGKDSKKYLLIPELNPLKTISDINQIKPKFFKKLTAVAEEKNLNQFFQAEKTKAKLVTCTWEERSTRVFFRFLSL